VTATSPRSRLPRIGERFGSPPGRLKPRGARADAAGAPRGSRPGGPLTAVAASLASGALYALLFPPFGWVALSWVALVPLILALRGRGPLAAAGLAALQMSLATGLVVAWLVPTLEGHFERSPARAILFLLFLSACAAAPFHALAFAARARARRAPAWLAPVLFAAAWVASEWLRGQLGLRSPWGKLGDAHFASPRLRQVADLGGVYAVSALVALGNFAAAEALHALGQRLSGRALDLARPAVALLLAAVLLAAALLYGDSRRGAWGGSAEELELAVVQGDVDVELRWRRASASHVVRRYLSLTREELARPAGRPLDLVLWPENAIQTSLDDPVYGGAVRGLARAGVPLLIGAPRRERREGHLLHFNSAQLLRPDGSLEHYDKRRLLPFSETHPLGGLRLAPRGDLDQGEYAAGEAPGLFEVAGTRVGVLICLEALYPELAREAAVGGARLLVNLSNDGWYRGRGGAEQHLAQVVFRAIETRLPVARATTTGISALVAPDGGIAARLDAGERGVLRAAVRLGAGGASPYLRWGDAFAGACLAVLAAGALAPFLPGRRALRRRARAPGAAGGLPAPSGTPG